MKVNKEIQFYHPPEHQEHPGVMIDPRDMRDLREERREALEINDHLDSRISPQFDQDSSNYDATAEFLN